MLDKNANRVYSINDNTNLMKGNTMRKYEEVSNLMYSIAHRIKLNTESAHDMVQDAWIKGSLHGCEDHQLSRTITNAMLDARRARSGRVGSVRLTTEVDTVSLSDISNDKLDALAYIDPSSTETTDLVDKLLENLDFTEHLVVRCRIYSGMTYLKIAEEWGMSSQSTVLNVFNRAITKMKESKLARELV
jgi:RNA polymerase sigma factor (sigma-70 family)